MNKSASPIFHGLDHLRALAITLVFYFHYFILSGGEPAWLPDWAAFGWTGVDLFFVLSGFLIASQLFEQVQRSGGISFRLFFMKRAFRILPAYLVTVALYVCWPLFREREALPPVWKLLTFTQNIGLNIKDNGTFSHAWSLCVEEHFYLLLPLLLIGIHRTRFWRKAWLLLPALLVLGLLWRWYAYEILYSPHAAGDIPWKYWYQHIYYPTYSRLDGLLAGVAIAACYVFRKQWWEQLTARSGYLLLMALAVLAGAYFLCADQQTKAASVWGFPLVAFGYGLLLMNAVCKGSFLSRHASRITHWVAGLSYSIYLTHKGIIHLTRVALQDYELNPNILLLICTVTSLLGAYLLHQLVEQPFLRWRNRILH